MLRMHLTGLVVLLVVGRADSWAEGGGLPVRRCCWLGWVHSDKRCEARQPITSNTSAVLTWGNLVSQHHFQHCHISGESIKNMQSQLNVFADVLFGGPVG